MGMWSYVTEKYRPDPCTCCGAVEVEGQWWSLRGYFGVNGYFCPNCMDKVHHDPYGNPFNPEQYKAVLVQQTLERTK